MHRASIAVIVGCLAWLSLPAQLLADSPSHGSILVPGDHILPGQSFTISGYDLDPRAELELAIVRGALAPVSLGRVTVGMDGAINETVTLPADFPNGYATVTATASAESQWTTSVLVGERAEGPGASGIAIDSGGPFIDPAAIGLAMVVVGFIVFVMAARRYVRGRPKDGAAAR